MQYTIILFVMLALFSCQREKNKEPIDFPKMEATIRATVDSSYRAFIALDAGKFLSYYTSESNFKHFNDGILLNENKASLDEMIKTNYKLLKSVEDVKLDTIYVHILNSESAVATVSFDEMIITTSGDSLPNKGFWTNVFVKKANGWKIVHGHSSHID